VGRSGMQEKNGLRRTARRGNGSLKEISELRVKVETGSKSRLLVESGNQGIVLETARGSTWNVQAD